ncbi:MAG: helix-turn-helix domain-containing protein [Cyanobacteriota bacterium]|nr:helix-turn-helix domain-containing protein [Cyanobacteriota bacterium]
MPQTCSPEAAPLHIAPADIGLAPVLDTEDFSQWEASVTTTLGHHRSELLSPRQPFHACLRAGALGGYGVVGIQGRGRLRLVRTQREAWVLWLPLQGLTAERINGTPWLAEPGMGLLFRCGDDMVGETSLEQEGLSILIPPALQPDGEGPASPLLAQGTPPQALLASARHLATAAAQRPPGAAHAADQFTEALRLWWESDRSNVRPRRPARRRQWMVGEAREWMAARLTERFTLAELSAAMELSPRQLQYSFLQEVGRSPMAEAKRLRLRHLRTLLQDPAQAKRGVADLMAASGLVASGVTAADYRRWCGERPRETRLRR